MRPPPSPSRPVRCPCCACSLAALPAACATFADEVAQLYPHELSERIWEPLLLLAAAGVAISFVLGSGGGASASVAFLPLVVHRIAAPVWFDGAALFFGWGWYSPSSPPMQPAAALSRSCRALDGFGVALSAILAGLQVFVSTAVTGFASISFTVAALPLWTATGL